MPPATYNPCFFGPPRRGIGGAAPAPNRHGRERPFRNGGPEKQSRGIPLDFRVTRRRAPPFAKATEGYPARIHPRVYTRGFLRRRVNQLPTKEGEKLPKKSTKRQQKRSITCKQRNNADGTRTVFSVQTQSGIGIYYRRAQRGL